MMRDILHLPASMRIHGFYTTKRILFGVGSLKRIGVEAKKIAKRSVILISDKSIRRLGLLDKVIESLEQENLDIEVFSEFRPEPHLEDVQKITERVRAGKYDLIIGVGGGSAMDVAKVGSIMAINPGDVTRYIGGTVEDDKVNNQPIPKILVPTTSGTGSEVSMGAVFSIKHHKVGIRSPKNLPEVAMIDPMMTVSMPPSVTASTGIDALSHAIESTMNIMANVITDALAYQSIKLVADNLLTAFTQRDNTEARYNMSLAATLAGMSQTQHSCAIAHAMANAFSAKMNIPHGISLAVALPYTIEFNLPACTKKLAIIASLMGEKVSGASTREAALRALVSIKRLIEDLELPTKLKDLNIPKSDIPKLVEDTINFGGGMLSRNVRKASKDDLTRLFIKMWEGEVTSNVH